MTLSMTETRRSRRCCSRRRAGRARRRCRRRGARVLRACHRGGGRRACADDAGRRHVERRSRTDHRRRRAHDEPAPRAVRDESGVPPRRAAAVRYAAWVASDPFDIGVTTARVARVPADGGVRRARAGRRRDVAMTEAARERCMRSKANGSLMRATPLAVWGARRDARRRARRGGAGRCAPLASQRSVRRCVHGVRARDRVADPRARRRRGRVRRGERVGRASACAEVRGWLDDAAAGTVVPYTPQDGFVRIAFTHAFRHLRLGTSYLEALRETLAGGGDTDTNACIVGGLVGARWGARAIPEAMRAAVLGCDTTARSERAAPTSSIRAPFRRRSGACCRMKTPVATAGELRSNRDHGEGIGEAT